MKNKKWIIMLNFKDSDRYILNSSKLDVSDEELEECIKYQIYEHVFKRIKD